MAVDETLLRLVGEAEAIHACKPATIPEIVDAARRMNELRVAVAKIAAVDVDAKATKARFVTVYREFIAAHHAAGRARAAQAAVKRAEALAARDERLRERAAAIAAAASERERRQADLAERRNAILQKRDERARALEARDQQRAATAAAAADRRRQLILIEGMRAMLDVPIDKLPNAARIDEIWRSQAGRVDGDLLKQYLDAKAKVWRRAETIVKRSARSRL